MTTAAAPLESIPAAAVILLRDGAGGIEALIQRRRKQASTFGGVLAFPGGKLAAIDHDPRFAELADLGPPHPFEPARQLAALRELFEESAILLARGTSGTAAREVLLKHRERLDHEPTLWPALLAECGLRLTADALVPWARWVTPNFAPRDEWFDVTLFAADAPVSQAPIGGREADEYLWARPAELLAAADLGEIEILFIMRMNLMRLAQYTKVADALAAGRRGPHPMIQPRKIETADGEIVVIPDDAPYPVRRLLFAHLSEVFNKAGRKP